jgi:uncharacterized protein (TIGR00255 family)
MTGFGRAAWARGGESIEIEVRSVNGRHLSVSWRAPETLAAGEIEAEKTVRESISRGSVTVTVRCRSPKLAPGYIVDEALLKTYRDTFAAAGKKLKLSGEVSIDTLAALPGVVRSNGAPAAAPPALWKQVRATLAKALAAHSTARTTEGRALVRDLKERGAALEGLLDRVEQRAPAVVRQAQKKVAARVQELLGAAAAKESAEAIAREAAMLAQRGDITEECVRMRHHLKDLAAALKSKGAVGRKLDFLAQEMLREVNTIGSKANDPAITKCVVAAKAEVDRIKEQAANLE